jgi:hypothetical protein
MCDPVREHERRISKMAGDDLLAADACEGGADATSRSGDARHLMASRTVFRNESLCFVELRAVRCAATGGERAGEQEQR